MSLIISGVNIQDPRPHPRTIQGHRVSTRFGGGARPRRPSRCTTLLPLVLLCSALVPLARGQITFANFPVRVSAQGELANFWQVRDATLRETGTETSGSLELKNILGAAVDGAVFYGEYFDAKGRFCFSLVFSQARNLLNSGPIAPGEVREVASSSVGLFAASEPEEVRLYLVQQRQAHRPNSLRRWDVPFRAPVTVTGSLDPETSKLQLDSGLVPSKEPFLDLLLARVSVNQRGQVEAVDVLDAASGAPESRLVSFIRELIFLPATDNGAPKTAQTLLLVRAVLSNDKDRIQNSPFPPRMSGWVKSYLARLTDIEVPPVTEILFARPTGKINRAGTNEWVDRPPAPPGLFEATAWNSDWSVPAFRTVVDPSMPHHLRRELVAPHQP
jgi:hypothetical protein